MMEKAGQNVLRSTADALGLGRRLIQRRAVAAAAEAAGAALGISPLPVWNLQNFDEAVCVAGDKGASAVELAEEILASRMPIGEIAAAAGRLTDRAAIVRLAESRVEKAAVGAGRATDIALMGAVMPRELLAGMYLYALRHLAA